MRKYSKRKRCEILTLMPLRFEYTRDQVEAAVAASRSYVGVARILGYSNRGSNAMIKRWIAHYEISTDHFGGRGSHLGRSPNIEHSRAELTAAVAVSRTYSDVCRALGRSTNGGTHTHIRRTIARLGLDTSHFLTRAESAVASWQPNGFAPISAERTLVMLPSGSNRERSSTLRKLMIEAGTEHVCLTCRIGPEWNGIPLVLQVDHIDGNPLSNQLSNLRFLCPNCHTQQDTSTLRGRKVRSVQLASHT